MITVKPLSPSVVKVKGGDPTKVNVTSASVIVGPPGPTGPQGLPGANGAPGATGPQGPQGVPGQDGAQGPQGIPGVQGVPGVDGAAGVQGQPGANGEQGPAGPAGTNGTNGTNGQDGAPGQDGAQGPKGDTGEQGPPGADGAQGPQGPEGPLNPDALTTADKDVPNGLATLDASGSIVQRIKSAANSTPIGMRDAAGEGNGKASLFTESIAIDGQSTALVRTGVWRGELSYAFQVFGPAGDGVVRLDLFRMIVDGTPIYGYTNLGTIPVTVTFGMFADGYSGWAWSGDFGRAQFVVTEAAVVGNGTDDAAVRDWTMYAANDLSLLSSQVTVPRVNLA